MELVKIGSNNFTSFITVPSYNVNRVPKYEEWTDSNYTLHRDVVRRRVEGSFTFKFQTVVEYETFLTAISNGLQTDGSVQATLYLNNERIVYQSYYFFEFTPDNNLPILFHEDDDGFEVTIQER